MRARVSASCVPSSPRKLSTPVTKVCMLCTSACMLVSALRLPSCTMYWRSCGICAANTPDIDGQTRIRKLQAVRTSVSFSSKKVLGAESTTILPDSLRKSRELTQNTGRSTSASYTVTPISDRSCCVDRGTGYLDFCCGRSGRRCARAASATAALRLHSSHSPAAERDHHKQAERQTDLAILASALCISKRPSLKSFCSCVLLYRLRAKVAARRSYEHRMS
jgi:hypothetical protein